MPTFIIQDHICTFGKNYDRGIVSGEGCSRQGEGRRSCKTHKMEIRLFADVNLFCLVLRLDLLVELIDEVVNKYRWQWIC